MVSKSEPSMGDLPYHPLDEGDIADYELSLVSIALMHPDFVKGVELPCEAFRCDAYGQVWVALKKWPDDYERRLDALLALGLSTDEMIRIETAEPMPLKAGWLARQVITAHNRRKLYRKMYSNLGKIYSNCDVGVDEIIEDVKSISHLKVDEDDRTKISSVLQIIVGGDVQDHVVKTGFSSLDEEIRGFPIGTISLVAARPGIGKSVFALNCARKQAIHGIPALYVGLEDSVTQYAKRAVVSEARVPYAFFNGASIPDYEMCRLQEAFLILRDAPLFLEDSAFYCSDIISCIRSHVSMYGIKIAYIDHIQEVFPDEEDRSSNRAYDLEKIVQRFRNLAKLLGIAIVLVAQINRDVERRVDPRPRMSDLRDSGALEMIARLILLLYRQDYYEEDPTAHDGLMDVHIAKSNHGRAGNVIQLSWIGAKSLVEEVLDGR
jgi:replicative DNA helicase